MNREAKNDQQVPLPPARSQPWNEPFATPVQPYDPPTKRSRPVLVAGIVDIARYFLEFSYIAVTLLFLLIQQYLVATILILIAMIFIGRRATTRRQNEAES